MTNEIEEYRHNLCTLS